jgi:hypothetical protein
LDTYVGHTKVIQPHAVSSGGCQAFIDHLDGKIRILQAGVDTLRCLDDGLVLREADSDEAGGNVSLNADAHGQVVEGGAADAEDIVEVVALGRRLIAIRSGKFSKVRKFGIGAGLLVVDC